MFRLRLAAASPPKRRSIDLIVVDVNENVPNDEDDNFSHSSLISNTGDHRLLRDCVDSSNRRYATGSIGVIW